ncbi:MAG: S49 family peptidase [Candidatus Acetothermia bacterium]|jgi:protease-4|nr:S49 family peptidase [Candidatus Acetothermia bacterium]
MLGYIAFALRYGVWKLANLHRRLRWAPDYVLFVLDGTYPDLRPPRAGFVQRKLFPPETSLQDLAERFRAVAGDPRVRGVVLNLRFLDMPLPQLQTLRDLIAELQAAGKRVVAWSTRYDTASYYVACAADEILLQPGGGIAPLGLRQGFLFLADALEHLGIQADVVQISPYKTAFDTVARSSMSAEMREMVDWLMDDRYAQLLQGIATGRRMDEGRATALVDNAPYTDLGAVEAGAVDRLAREEDLPAYLGTANRPARLLPWEEARPRVRRPPLPRPGRYVAVLRIEGTIVDGRSRRPPWKPPVRVPLVGGPRAGDLTVVQEARRALADRRAAAVVVYVDSGGGSATASEAMAAALSKLAAKKPVVVAMGAVAGSGGYYVATPACWIVAQPGTITGSIGVLAAKIVTAGLLDKLRSHRELITRGQHAAFYDPGRPFSDEERKKVWESIHRTYDVFVDRVQDARRLSREALDISGRGRVWTGRQARERGLVDELGGVEAALARARTLAGLHPRAPAREVKVGKRWLAPAQERATLLEYALEGLRALERAGPLLLCPLLWSDEGEGP